MVFGYYLGAGHAVADEAMGHGNNLWLGDLWLCKRLCASSSAVKFCFVWHLLTVTCEIGFLP